MEGAPRQLDIAGRAAGRGVRVVVRRGEPPFGARAAVVRALAVVPVRQQKHYAGALPPLRLRRRDELVDDALRVVGEVAELRLPQDERLVAGVHAVPVLEPQHGVLAERRVGRHEAVLAPEPEVIQRVHAAARPRAVQNRVAVVERPALDVLPGETHVTVRLLVVRLQHERAESEKLGGAPVHAGRLVQRRPRVRARRRGRADARLGRSHHRAPRRQQSAHVRVRDEIRGEQRLLRVRDQPSLERRALEARFPRRVVVVVVVVVDSKILLRGRVISRLLLRELRDRHPERAEQRQRHARGHRAGVAGPEGPRPGPRG